MNISDSTYNFALFLSFLAGMATVLGSFIAFFVKRTNTKALCYTLSFSAGAMLFLSFGDLLPHSYNTLKEGIGATRAGLYSALSMIVGIIFIGAIDKLLLKKSDPHASFPHKEMPDVHASPILGKAKMRHLSIITTLAIGIHNFPEGLATFISALDSAHVGYSVAIAIALHNIPEGISVSIPVFYSTGSRFKAIGVSFIAALSEPIGAFFGFLIIRNIIPPQLLSLMFSFVAGMMVFISFDELLPTSRAYGGSREVILGIIGGMGFMALGHLLGS